MAIVMTNSGRAVQTNLVSGLGGTAPNYIAIGSGAGTSAAADTTLFTEYTTGTWTGYARLNTTPTRGTTSVTNDTITWQSAAFTAPGAETVTNAGNFDQLASGGNCLIKGDFTGVVLATGDTLTVKVTLQYT
jgi:hypothetical protein